MLSVFFFIILNHKFIVITGVQEEFLVTARFTDAMPGKQMAIDAKMRVFNLRRIQKGGKK